MGPEFFSFVLAFNNLKVSKLSDRQLTYLADLLQSGYNEATDEISRRSSDNPSL